MLAWRACFAVFALCVGSGTTLGGGRTGPCLFFLFAFRVGSRNTLGGGLGLAWRTCFVVFALYVVSGTTLGGGLGLAWHACFVVFCLSPACVFWRVPFFVFLSWTFRACISSNSSPHRVPLRTANCWFVVLHIR